MSMSNERCVIVGGGHAARRGAQALRELAPLARIVVIGAEHELPYDRPVLSKGALLAADGERAAFIRDATWYAEHRIELCLGAEVVEIDRAGASVRLADGRREAYGKLLIATGSRVRTLPFDTPGVRIHYVRTVADARALRAELAPGKRVAILGGGFIGLEVAASAATLGCATTLIEPAPALLQRAMPASIGTFMHALHTRHGVDIRVDTRPVSIRREGAAFIVETDRGTLAADVIVAGIGVVPNVELAQQAGLEVNDGIVVDAGCRTRDALIFAAGEVTSHFNPLLGRHVRIESWQVAENQPLVAAANMLGGQAEYAEVPWLWSDTGPPAGRAQTG